MVLEEQQETRALIHINRFESQYDNQVKSLGAVDWRTLVGFFLSDPIVASDKTSVSLFNFAHYKGVDDVETGALVTSKISGQRYVRRAQENILFVDTLILDFDGEISVDEAKERFQKYSYVGYTSHSHMKEDAAERFRLLIQLSEPIPADMIAEGGSYPTKHGDWFYIRSALEDFAGPVDPTSLNSNQMYYVPSVHPDRIDFYDSWLNEGTPFDWTTLSRCHSAEPQNTQNELSQARRKSEFRLHPDDVLETGSGSIRVRDIDRNIDKVICPFHNDGEGGEFVALSKAGNVFLHCKHCGTAFMDEINGSSAELETQPKEELTASSRSDRSYTVEDFLEVEEVYHDASDRALVKKQLNDIANQIRKDSSKSSRNGTSYRNPRSHIILAPEGSGKSMLARTMTRMGDKIVFACKSWDQAFDKYEEFRKYGEKHDFTVELFLSRDAKAKRRFGVGAVREKASSPYKMGKILEEESVQKFKENNPELSDELIRVSWNFFEADRLYIRDYSPEINQPDDETANPLYDRFQMEHAGKNASLLVTTHAQLRILSQREQYLPRKRIVWIDDPDVADVIDIERYDPVRWREIEEENLEYKTKTINARQYYERPPNQSLGFNQRKHTCIYTTTESVTLKAIEKLLTDRNEEYVLHDKMNRLAGGQITILGTSKVRRKEDGIIPIISRLLQKQGYNNILIANGLAAPLNHSNNKGNNQLSETTILVELSIPHPDEVRTYCDALGMHFGKDSNEMGRMLVLDRMHQAIGRNSGYRSKGYECVVLVDSSYHRHLVNNVRYAIDKKNSVLIDRTADMSRKDRRTTAAASDFVAATESLLLTVDQLVSDTRKTKPAIKHVVNSIDDRDKREAYIARLLASLASHSGKNMWGSEQPEVPENRLQEQYYALGNWILGNFVSKERLKHILSEYRKILLF